VADDESLVADASDRLASVAAAEAIIAKLAPPMADQLRRLNVASTTDAAKRLAAATQLACQPDQVGAFARRKARLRPSTRPSTASAALDDALKSLECQLLASPALAAGADEDVVSNSTSAMPSAFAVATGSRQPSRPRRR
jgi:hypothetical protein